MRDKILDTIQVIFRDVLENDEIVLQMTSTADDIEEWDSLNHVQIVFSIEKFYHIKFTTREILSWQSISDLVDTIIDKQK